MRHMLPAFESMEERILLADWTVLVYLDGDNDLESASIKDINEMEQIGSTASVNVVVQMDRINGYNTSNSDWTDTRRGKIIYDTVSTGIGSTLTSIGEVNMGDAATLTDFIEWGVANFPANKYALIVWDHGGGLDGVAWDDTSDDNLDVSELAQALSDSGVYFDLIGFDACLMGMMEVAYEIAPYTDTIVASEDTIPFNGWNYEDVLTDLTTTPTMTSADFGSAIVDRYGTWYEYYTLSALSSAGVLDFATAFDALSDEIIAANDWDNLSDARWDAAYFDEYDYRDLGTLVDYFATYGAGNVLTAAQTASNAFESAVINAYGYDSTGMTIYLPSRYGTVDSSYTADNFDFLADTSWLTALQTFTNEIVPDPDPEPEPDPVYEANLTAWINPYSVQLEVRPGTGKGAGLTSVPFTIYNEGYIPASGYVTVDLYAAEGTAIEKTSILITSKIYKISLSPWFSKALKMKKVIVPELDLGDYHLIVDINPNQAITESDYTDNTAYSSAVTWLDSGVDMSASVVVAATQNHINSSSYLSNVSLVLSNNGVIQSRGMLTVNLYASSDNTKDGGDTLIATISIKATVSPYIAKAVKLSRVLAPVLAAGNYYLIAELNPDAALVETDYSNNTSATASAVSWS